MCGRYGLYDAEDFTERFMAAPPEPIKPNYNAAPGQYMPVVIASEGERKVETMKWGLVPQWAKDEKIGYKMINARAESVFEKPAWRGPVRRHRALIPANGFYEWKQLPQQKTKQPYYIHPTDQKLFAFAGMYEARKDSDGTMLCTFTIITTKPNADMLRIHDRMPVMLLPYQETIWLDPAVSDENMLAELLQPYPDGSLSMFEVSTDVNTVKNNDDHLVKPINSK